MSAAGLCQAALHILKDGAKSKHAETLRIVWRFIMAVVPPIGSHQTYSAAMALLVSGGCVELTVAHVAEAGPDMLIFGVRLFNHFLRDSRAQERMCAPRMVDSIMKWLSKGLSQVRNVVVWCRAQWKSSGTVEELLGLQVGAIVWNPTARKLGLGVLECNIIREGPPPRSFRSA